jgi:meso-butanediol dehydrogenase/(S,S)-butanediol dehydrogenase/diacetyl reductase
MSVSKNSRCVAGGVVAACLESSLTLYALAMDAGSLPDAPRVLVTGGGRGIGRAIALRFARAGARVAVAARTRFEVEQVSREIDSAGGRGLAVAMDVTDLAQVEEGLHQTLEFGDGGLDVLVNNAGVFDIHPIDEISPATWYRTLAVNLTGPFHVTLLALKGLEASPRAHVFNISSIAGKQAFPGNLAYCTTKFGLRGFSDALRLDLAGRGIRVSTVYPGATDTTIFDGVPGDWDRASMNRPEDVAEVLWSAWRAPADQPVDDLDVPPRTLTDG